MMAPEVVVLSALRIKVKCLVTRLFWECLHSELVILKTKG